LSNQNVYSIIGVEDGSFKGFPRLNFNKTLLCAVNTVGITIKEVRFTEISIDGYDATENLLKMIRNMNYDVIILGGISFAGFNLVDAKKVNLLTGKPVIIYMGKRPDSVKMLNAIKKLYPNWMEKWRLITDLGELYSAEVKKGDQKIFYEIIGESSVWGLKILKQAAILCRIPEPVRLANLIGKGVTRNY